MTYCLLREYNAIDGAAKEVLPHGHVEMPGDRVGESLPSSAHYLAKAMHRRRGMEGLQEINGGGARRLEPPPQLSLILAPAAQT